MTASYRVTVRLQVKKKGVVLNPKILDERLEGKNLTKSVTDDIIEKVRAAFSK